MQIFIHFLELRECDGGTVEEFRGQPSFLIAAVSDRCANRSLWAIHCCRESKICPGPPDSRIKGFRAALISNLTAGASHFRERVVAAVALSPNHTCLARALSRLWVTCARVGAQMEAVTGETGITVFRLIVIVLAATFSSSLVAVRIETFADITVARTTHGVSPPTPRTRFFNFVFTVLSIVVLTALACVPMRRAQFTNTCGQMLTRVQMTGINAVSAEETGITGAGVFVCTLAVLGTVDDVAGFAHVTAVLHADLLRVLHVDGSCTGGCFPHSDTLHASLKPLLDNVPLALKSTNEQTLQLESRKLISDLC